MMTSHIRIAGSRATTMLAVVAATICDCGLAQTPEKSGVSPAVISLPSGPGSIEGLGESFEPQLNTGTSSYSVKIALPPGRAGFQPSLALTYNSGLGNSLVGIGWSLAIPQIKRQTDKGFPAYHAGDTCLFEGEELVALSDGTFRCENETGFQRFRRIDLDADFLPEAWEMTEPNGVRHIFGQYHGAGGRWSAVLHPAPPPTSTGSPFDTTYCWALDTSIDLHGNRIEYEYELGTGMLYPSRITYSHNGLNQHEVVFDYELRADVFEDYRATFCCQTDRRLAGIEVRTNGTTVRSYSLGYSHEAGDSTPLSLAEQTARANAFAFGVSILKRIVQHDRLGTNHLPPLIFHYSFLDRNLAGAVVAEAASPPLLDLANTEGDVQIADVDGDGLPDIFSTQDLSMVRVQQVCLNRGPDGSGNIRFTNPQLIANPSNLDLGSAESSLADFDGDGLIDFIRLYDEFPGKRIDVRANQTRLDCSTGSLGFKTGAPTATHYLNSAPAYLDLANPGLRQMDLNFDKVSDFLYSQSAFPVPEFFGSYQDADGIWHHEQFLMPSDLPGGVLFEQGGQSNPAVHLADMNGDRLQDLVYLSTSGGGIGATLTVRYWAYRGLGRWTAGRVMQLNPGDTFQIDGADLRDFFVQDFTGDGLADILQMDGSGMDSILSLRANIAGMTWAIPVVKTGLPEYRPRAGVTPTTFRIADLNGNGSVDLIWRNTGFNNTWKWLDLIPDAGTPHLLTRIDNSIGKVTCIDYGNAHQDYIRAADAGHPWTSKLPFAVQVVRRIRSSCGYDLNGDGLPDTSVTDLKYRDGFFDGFEKEFRGFAFAERIDYGDDFLWNENLGVIGPSAGWNSGATPTGQVPGPSLVTRYRFHTGAADRLDNDSPPAGQAVGLVDEFTERAGREEECLKGKLLVEEKIDPWVLHNSAAGTFDAVAAAAANAGSLHAPITPDAQVYLRSRQSWAVRRLYRPTETIDTWVDQDRDGVLAYFGDIAPVPVGRFAATPVVNGDGRSVSFAFVERIESETIDANGLLTEALGYPVRGPVGTRQEFDFDNYGNQILSIDHGILDPAYDDERKVVTTYAHGGSALNKWVIDRPDTILTTDETGTFVNKTVNHYDGTPYVGEPGSIGQRALLHRVQKFIDPITPLDATRSAYDAFGNVTGMRDPDFGTPFGTSGGHSRSIQYDAAFQTYPVSETIAVGGGSPDLVMSASYDCGFGVVESSTDFNGNLTDYEYDSFGRLVVIVKPGDTSGSPTLLAEYQAFDPGRGELYSYARSGALTKSGAAGRANRVVTHARETAGGGVYVTATYTDGLGKQIAAVGEDEDGGKWVVSSATSHNLRGAPAKAWLPYQISSAGVPTFSTVWPAGRPPATDGASPSVVSSDSFADPLGRVIRTIRPPETWSGARKETRTQHLPFEIVNLDEHDSDPASQFAGTPAVHFQDGLGRLVKVREMVSLTDTGEPGGTAAWETLYRYDLNDKLARITDSQNNVKVMNHDGLGRLVFMDDPNRGILDHVYSHASNLIQTTDAKGQVIKCTYDGANRILTEDYLDEGLPFSANHLFDPAQAVSQANRPDVAYFYDQPVSGLDLGNGSTGTASNPKAQLCHVWDLTGEEHFSYDARGRLAWQVKRIPDALLADVLVSYKTSYSYDSLDRLTTLTYPDGDRVVHGYNARILPETITAGGGTTIISDVDYRPSSQLARIAYGNGVTAGCEYDPRLRLRELDADSSSAGKLIDYSYALDPAGNITRISDNRTLTGQPDATPRRNTQVFQYDDLYRLTQVVYPALVDGSDGFIDYRYDRIGNMLKNLSNISHAENGRSITNLGVMTYGGPLGASGRSGRGTSAAGPHALSGVSADGGRSFPYDANGNMTEIDGLHCSWDFKDRLVRVENDTMIACYRYDHADRRVIKQVTTKGADNGSTPTARMTHYVNKYFETRPAEPPVKYVWNGDTRVARITAHLDQTARKTRHLRLRSGWNLCGLNVSGVGAQLDPASHPALEAAVWWDDNTDTWQPMTQGPVPAHAPVWLHASADTVLGIHGIPAPPTDASLAPGQGTFILNTTEAPIDSALLPANAELWRWEPSAADWRVTLAGNLAPLTAKDSAAFDPGAVIFARSAAGATIRQTPDPALEVRFYHQDHLGSSNVMTDRHGNLVEETANFPFGGVRNAHSPQSLAEPYGFIQKEQDAESGLHYFEARYLSSTLGRFVNVDPMASQVVEPARAAERREPTSNAYAYSFNNPITFIDSRGLEGETPPALSADTNDDREISRGTIRTARGGRSAMDYLDSTTIAVTRGNPADVSGSDVWEQGGGVYQGIHCQGSEEACAALTDQNTKPTEETNKGGSVTGTSSTGPSPEAPEQPRIASAKSNTTPAPGKTTPTYGKSKFYNTLKTVSGWAWSKVLKATGQEDRAWKNGVERPVSGSNGVRG